MIKTQHAIGALVGSAVGDALGAPFEFKRPGPYRSTFPAPVLGGIGEMRGGGFNWKPAEFTDDTQMALALAESLIANDGFDAADLWNRWQTLARTARDVGTHTREVLAERFHVGAAERVHNRNSHSAGNGSVMRNTPIALWAAADSLDALVALATQQAVLTHHDPHNGYGAAIHAAMIRAGMRGDDVFDAIDTIDALLAEDASRQILVHCHGGRSRTAFVLKGWAMRRFGWTEEAAHRWLEQQWDRIDRINEQLVHLLRSEWLRKV